MTVKIGMMSFAHLHALSYVGVLLFVVSFVVRAIAQLLVWYATRGRTLGREG